MLFRLPCHLRKPFKSRLKLICERRSAIHSPNPIGLINTSPVV